MAPIVQEFGFSANNHSTPVLQEIRQSYVCGVPVVHGNYKELSSKVMTWLRHCVSLCQPDEVHIMDGSQKEENQLKAMLVSKGVLTPLPKYTNCFLARTDPRDVARTEGRTFLSTNTKEESIPEPAPGVKGALGNWISPEELDKKVNSLFPGCMKGRTMYVIPFSMGPVGSPLSKIGIEVTDSAYVAISMRIMTRIGKQVLRVLENEDFVKCLHSVGVPLTNRANDVAWPCNPENVLVAHKPNTMEIISFGSGYGGNSLLGKKCLALRLGSAAARKEGWFAEHMLITGIEGPDGEKKYIAAAFPSACGKTNLAMMKPKIPGYKVTVVGDDIAWIRPDSNGILRAINPENGFFGVAPGTSFSSNPIAMETIFKDTIFSNVALTPDGGVYWEGMENKPEEAIDWQGRPWTPACKTPAAHPNSRFCSPIVNCPTVDGAWQDPNGVPISAILFGGRRPEGVPLVYQAIDWEHAVFMGACVKSEATAAAEHKGKVIMHDPFSMRPFFGYNFGDYLQHWISMEKKIPKEHLPAVFMVNWFRKGEDKSFLWPGFGENIRVLEWILKRTSGKVGAVKSPIGYLPCKQDINLAGLSSKPDMEELMSVPKEFWREEAKELSQYFQDQVGESVPEQIWKQLQHLEQRLN